MPSTLSTATINTPLTAYAYGIMGDRLAAMRLANILSPVVRVSAASGPYKKFDDRNAFLVEDMKRAVGGPRKRLGFDATDDSYNCQPYGVEISVDDFELDAAGNNGALAANLVGQGKMKSLIARKALAYAKRVADYVFANLTPVADRGNWTNNNVDPIDQIDEQLVALATETGTTENKHLVLSVLDWSKLRNNAKVKSRLGIKDGLSLKIGNLVDGLVYPVQIEISGVSYTGTKRGQETVTKAQVAAGYCLAVHTEPNATIEDASAFKTFSTSDVLVDSVKTYRDENSNSDVHAMDWSEDIKKTGSACARLLAIS